MSISKHITTHSKHVGTQLDTQVIHAGQQPEPITGAVMPPIFTTSTYAQARPGEHTGFDYSRTKNPTRLAFERNIAALEQGQDGFAFASGMAAINTVLSLLQPGDHILVMHDVYGGTYRLFTQVLTRSAGLTFTFVDMTQLDRVKAALRPETKMIWVESPSNPLLQIVDLAAIADIGRAQGAMIVADNTFATPILQQPLTLGANLVVHSVTKYLNGHSDVIGGMVVTDSETLSEKMGYLQNSAGAILDPFSSFMALRGVKTLALRMQRHCENAMALAQWLLSQPWVEHVYYPGLPQHPQHALASTQMKGFGGMISATLKLDKQQTATLLAHCRVFTLAESLGGVESLIEQPAIMTHASIPAAERQKLGIDDSLVRLSVGVEHIDDLIADLLQAYQSVGR